MTRPRWELMDEYEAVAADAWRALAAVLDHPETTPYEPQRAALADAMRRLTYDAACGDCVEGRCHWGGDADPAHGECGCRRHAFSVEVRQREQSKGATSA